MTPPAAAIQPETPPGGVPRGGGAVSQSGAGRGRSPPIIVNPAYRTVTPHPEPSTDVPHPPSYRNFIAHIPTGHVRSIAGSGTRTADTCGTVRGWAACSKDKSHGATPLRESCDDAECPECWPGWATKQSRRVSERLRGYIRAARPEESLQSFSAPGEDVFTYYDPELRKFWSVGHKENAQQVRHWIISPPEDEITPEMDQDAIHSIGKFWCRWIGIKGGTIVFHPWRILPDIKLRLSALIRRGARESEEEYEKKFWQSIREDVLGLGNWVDYVYWSPHYHVIGFGFTCDSANFYRLTGWMFKFIRNVSQKRQWDGQRMKDDIAALTYYLLSHCAIVWGKKAVIWYGCMTPTNLKKVGDKPQVDLYEKQCAKCKAQEIVYLLDDNGEAGEPSIGREGVQYLFYRDKFWLYHIVTEGEKDERRQRRKEERARTRRAKAG